MTMRIPTATYRIQFHAGFGFQHARRIVSYLRDLGITDVYASPIFKARPGSRHGYDGIDPGELNSELGTLEEFETLVASLEKQGMGWLQDVVPNHLAFDSENPMLRDLLEKGGRSPYRYFFDIDWDHPDEALKGKVLAPFLGKRFGDALEAGELKLVLDSSGFSVNYRGISFPLKRQTCRFIAEHRRSELEAALKEHPTDLERYRHLLSAMESQAVPSVGNDLRNLYRSCSAFRLHIDENLAIYNGTPGDAESFGLLEGLLDRQVFRLSHWKTAAGEINYRRFFDINELICLRAEAEAVFEHTHRLVLRLAGEKRITGLRIDHIDGLRDPQAYLERLRKALSDTFIVVEKILAPEESLPSPWPVQGTTGYEFAMYLNGLFCRRAHEGKMENLYREFAGTIVSPETLLVQCKRRVLEKQMAGDLDNLAHLMKRLSGGLRHGRDLVREALKKALEEALVRFPVYRTYVGKGGVGKGDEEKIRSVLKEVGLRNPDLSHELSFIGKVLLLEDPAERLSEDQKELRQKAVGRFQQLSAPLTAKGFEDTFLYVYNRLVSLNEVGGKPERFGFSPEAFHEFIRSRQKSWPYSMNATTTHDTKRGEDVRTRIDLLSEIPEAWGKAVFAWREINRAKGRQAGDKPVPDGNTEYFFYQTLVGAFPFSETELSGFTERMKEYMVKAAREAKIHTDWMDPDAVYEEALAAFVEEVLGDKRFLLAFLPFQRRISWYGMLSSLSQVLIKIAAPGVPDFYQGCELWDLNLVDPDNRRPVDFARRMSLLSQIREVESADLSSLMGDLLRHPESGKIKLFMISRALRARAAQRVLFMDGDYIPLEATGKRSDHLMVFARQKDGLWSLTAAPRFLASLARPGEYPLGEGVWDDTEIFLPDDAPSTWEDVFTAGRCQGSPSLRAAAVFRDFPVALLIGSA